MDGVFFIVALAVGGLFLTAAAVAGWEHRRRIAAMNRRLTRSEASRFAAEQEAEAKEAQVETMHRALRDQRRAAASAGSMTMPEMPLPVVGDQAQRQWTLHDAFGRMAQIPRPAAPVWVDTEPMVGASLAPEFAPTMPADVELILLP